MVKGLSSMNNDHKRTGWELVDPEESWEIMLKKNKEEKIIGNGEKNTNGNEEIINVEYIHRQLQDLVNAENLHTLKRLIVTRLEAKRAIQRGLCLKRSALEKCDAVMCDASIYFDANQSISASHGLDSLDSLDPLDQVRQSLSKRLDELKRKEMQQSIEKLNVESFKVASSSIDEKASILKEALYQLDLAKESFLKKRKLAILKRKNILRMANQCIQTELPTSTSILANLDQFDASRFLFLHGNHDTNHTNHSNDFNIDVQEIDQEWKWKYQGLFQDAKSLFSLPVSASPLDFYRIVEYEKQKSLVGWDLLHEKLNGIHGLINDQSEHLVKDLAARVQNQSLFWSSFANDMARMDKVLDSDCHCLKDNIALFRQNSLTLNDEQLQDTLGKMNLILNDVALL